MYQSSKLFKLIKIVIDFSYIVFLFILALSFITAIILLFSPADTFIIQEDYPYKIANNQGETPYISSTIETKYLNGSFSKIKRNPKSAMLIRTFFYSIPTALFLVLGFYLLRKIIDDLFIISKRFKTRQVKYLKIISVMVAFYFLFVDLIVQQVYSIWLGHTLIYIRTMHFSGLLYAGLVYLLAEVFNYGVYLQESYDTTL